MIWFRRFVAVILAVLFLAIFVAMLFLWRVNATFGNPSFYVTQLRQADIYNFTYDRALPAALEEVETGTQDVPLDVSQYEDEALLLARQILPPQWVQARVEEAIKQVMPYMLGDTEKFAVNVPLKERVLAAQKALKDTLHEGDTFSNLYEELVSRAVDEASSNLDKLPFKLTLTRQELDSMVRKVVSQEWLLAQLDLAIDNTFPYLAGDAEHFTIAVELKSRAQAAGEVAIDRLGRLETYDYIFDEVVAPQIVQQVGKSVQLPLGITLTDQEVTAALKQILPQPWFEARLKDLVTQTIAYLRGDSSTIDVAVPLADRKAATLTVLDDLANAKLRALWQSLPEARPEQVPDILRSLQAGQLPAYRPPGLSYEQARQMLGIVFTQAISGSIIDQIPNQVSITQAGLTQFMGEKNGNNLNKVRQHVSQGWTFTDADLHQRLGIEQTANLDDARNRIKSGFTFTQADLRQQLEKTPDGATALSNLDQTRHTLRQARLWLFAGWIVPALLLAGIGALGARKLTGKILWAAAVLGIAALIGYIAAGPVYGSVARPQLVDALSHQPQETSQVAVVMMDKASEMAYRFADTFMAGVRQQALVALIIALIGVAAAIVLPMRWKQRQEGSPGDSQSNGR